MSVCCRSNSPSSSLWSQQEAERLNVTPGFTPSSKKMKEKKNLTFFLSSSELLRAPFQCLLQSPNEMNPSCHTVNGTQKMKLFISFLNFSACLDLFLQFQLFHFHYKFWPQTQKIIIMWLSCTDPTVFPRSSGIIESSAGWRPCT